MLNMNLKCRFQISNHSLLNKRTHEIIQYLAHHKQVQNLITASGEKAEADILGRFWGPTMKSIEGKGISGSHWGQSVEDKTHCKTRFEWYDIQQVFIEYWYVPAYFFAYQNYYKELYRKSTVTTTQETLMTNKLLPFLISIVMSMCKNNLELQKIFFSRISPPETFICFSSYLSIPRPLIIITLGTQDFPCTTPATIHDDMKHPTIPVPIWQLPTL